MDAMVAEKVFGQTTEVRERWRGACLCGRSETCAVCSWPLPYSTDIATAWEVIETIEHAGMTTVINSGPSGWYVGFQRQNEDGGSTVFKGEDWEAPLAICLAALKAVTP